MAWYALEEIDEAFQEMKELLLPFNLSVWSRLLLIVVLTGHGVNFPNFPSSLPGDSGADYKSTDYEMGEDIPTRSIEGSLGEMPATGLSTTSATGIWVLAGLAVIGILLLLIYLSSVFEFIFYQSLLDRNVSVRQNFRRHSGRGFSYFVFRIAATLLVISALAGSILAASMNPAGIALLAVFILGLIPVMVFLGLTHNFVLLSMIENDTGILAAWKNFYPHLRREWRQVGVYILARFAIKMVAGIAAAIWALTTLVILLVPFGIAGVIAYLVFQPLVWAVAALGALVWILIVLVVQIPIQSYLYYYAILVYHDLTS